MTNYCEARRYDFVGEEPEAPPCGHQACADDEARHAAGYEHESDWACPAGRCVLAWLQATCELDAGHAGDHDYGERSDPGTWHDVDLGNGHPWPNDWQDGRYVGAVS